MPDIQHQTISELVTKNYVHASVLYHFGVRFYDYQAETLGEVCHKHGLSLSHVVRSLESVDQDSVQNELQLVTYPIDLVLEYLTHTHHLFVKKRLPYIAQLIDGLENVNFRYRSLSVDLKQVFPLFVEDFIHHIYEEEDTLFSYIRLLARFLAGDAAGSRLYYSMESNAIREFALEHEEHEHEMEGLRKITNNYQYCDEADLHIKVLFDELAQFEKDLLTHAKIEDEILFPKALHLERQVKFKFYEIIKQN
jgi:regulator of cell morphogenesis and NO signaling